MFRRDLYRTMARVLDALDADAIAESSFRFAGGTCLALRHGEHRLSRDLDFVCSDGEGYGRLRYEVRSRSYDALFRKQAGLCFPREIRTDQYGIRFPVQVGDLAIRVELIREARIELGPAEREPWSALPLISVHDAFAEKLLANSDPWADRDDLSRDVIDLAILRDTHGPIPPAVWQTVEAAYRQAPRQDLERAARRLLDEPEYRQRCFVGLGVTREDAVIRGAALLLEDTTTTRQLPS